MATTNMICIHHPQGILGSGKSSKSDFGFFPFAFTKAKILKGEGASRAGPLCGPQCGEERGGRRKEGVCFAFCAAPDHGIQARTANSDPESTCIATAFSPPSRWVVSRLRQPPPGHRQSRHDFLTGSRRCRMTIAPCGSSVPCK